MSVTFTQLEKIMNNKSVQEEARRIAAEIVEKQSVRLENYAAHEGEPTYRKYHLHMAAELRAIAEKIRMTDRAQPAPVLKLFKQLSA